MARKLALIIANGQYEDAHLSKLAAPDVDARALAEILEIPSIGGFDEVQPVVNEGLATVRKAIARFFDARHRDNLLVMYFSGHGVRDEQGHLYLAVRDTERAVLAGTAIEASYVTARMDRSASKRLVLVLDCCHSGAFGYGSKGVHSASVGTATAFEGTGRGRVVLTATDATQFAWEGDQVIGDAENSLFTHYLIEGLRTGAADRDEDGQITIDELYDYVYNRVLHETPKQTPGKWAFGQQGEIVIAKNPALRQAKLPPELEEAVSSRLPSVRFEAVQELANVARGRHEVRALAARDALKRLTEDDSRRVAGAAIDFLKTLEPDISPLHRVELEPQPEVEAQAEEQERRLKAEAEARASRIATIVAAAQSALDRGALDDVGAMLGEASQLEPQHADVLRLKEKLQRAVEQRLRLEEAEQRIRAMRQRIATLIAQANAAEVHREAIALLNEALGLDPEHAEVKELLEERHRLQAEAEEAEQRARELASTKIIIEAYLDRGELEKAASTLKGAEPLAETPDVLAPLNERLAQLRETRRREAEEAARQKAEEERRRREAQEAARQKAETERRQREAEEAAQQKAEAEQRAREAEEAARKKAEEERLAREAEIARCLTAARTAIERKRFAEALDALGRAAQLESEDTWDERARLNGTGWEGCRGSRGAQASRN